jgi:hypothetical protein
MQPKQIIERGYSLKTYYFTGKYHKRTVGHYRAMRNKGIVYVPIYKSNDGEIIYDMAQMSKKEVNK